MFCRNCGKEIENDARFCPFCGTKTVMETEAEPEAVASQSVPQPEPVAEPAVTPDANPVADNASAFNTGNAAQNNYNPAFMPGAQGAAVKKEKSKKPVIVAAVAVVAVIAIVVGVLFATGMFGKSSPTYEVFEAAKKTVFESESATFNLFDGYAVAKVSIGDDLDDLKVYAEDENHPQFGVEGGKVYIRYESETTFEDMFEEFLGGPIKPLGIESFEDTLDNLLNGKIDEAVFKDIYNTAFRSVANQYAKIVYLDVRTDSDAEVMKYAEIDDITGEVTFDFDRIPVSLDLPDYDTVMDIVKEFLTKGLTEEEISVTKESGTYEYTANCARVVECFSEFVKDNETLSKLVKDISEIADMDEEEFYEELEYLAEELDDEELKIKGKVEIEDGYLTYVDAYAFEEGDDYEELIFDLKVKDINETEVRSSDIDSIDTYTPSYNSGFYW